MNRAVGNKLDVTDYLLQRRFPGFQGTEAASLNVRQTRSSVSIAERARKIREYRNELLKLSLGELKALVADEREKERQEAIERAKDEDDARFFNLSSARADFQHWAKASFWTLEEALALSFGKSPRIVSWSKIETHAGASPFVQKYRDARDLAFRAKAMGQLPDPVHPGIFIGWARRNDIEFPQELEDLVNSRGAVIGDWKTLYEKEAKDHLATRNQLSDHMEQAIKSKASQADMIAAKERTIHDLQDQLSALKAKMAKPEKVASLIREQESLLKIVMGMAFECYLHNPKLTRSSTAKEIAGDLLKHGLSLDEDTIRKFLQKGRSVLPPETE
jgi:hypothetical protein